MLINGESIIVGWNCVPLGRIYRNISGSSYTVCFQDICANLNVGKDGEEGKEFHIGNTLSKLSFLVSIDEYCILSR